MKYLLLALMLCVTSGCANKQVEWTPEMFRLKCVDGALWAYNGLGVETELDDQDKECERVAKLQAEKAQAK